MGEMFVGTSGFSFDDWIGEVYPPGIKKQDMLRYYEVNLGFTALEVNYTYYAMPSARTMESFSKRTSKGFSFVVKAYKGLTHEKGRDLKAQCRLFQQGVAPLDGNLKAVLFQFPYSFVPSDENIDYLKELRERFADYESVVEFRNVQWSGEERLDMLRSLSLGYCIVDEPKLKGLLPFTPALTSSTGYFRFHGRNRAWFREPVDVRYDYLYSEKEVEQFVAPIQNVSRQAKTTFVFFNNCHAGKAVKNAMMLIEMLKRQPSAVSTQPSAEAKKSFG
ncbi:MAG TPA: DUF72 domain-containing protein [Syntrophorhabdaceae bacterium]|nr:DUF72 domain-containing protein [Syntrophorhabdaceae bacterium]HNT69542.1 DUF72 domain-containing protein [Syntrophorhabdaceae bacterium]